MEYVGKVCPQNYEIVLRQLNSKISNVSHAILEIADLTRTAKKWTSDNATEWLLREYVGHLHHQRFLWEGWCN